VNSGKKIRLSICYEVKHLSGPLPTDLTISPKPIRKSTKIALIVLAVVLSSLGIYYYVMHNTFIVSVSIADDRIITSDGRGPYQHQADNGVWLDYENYFLLDVVGPRLVHVSFMDAQWKDSNLKFMPSPLPSKDYGMSVMVWENSSSPFEWIDPFKINVGDEFTLPKLHIQIFFYDPHTDAVVDINTIHEKGGFLTQFQNNTWIPSTTAEPPQSLRDESSITLTRTSEDTWVLNVDAWLASYYGPNLYSGNQKCYVKLTLSLTINKKRVI
jgi:hypothetical protein